MLTETWRDTFARTAPTVHAHLELVADDGTVVFVHEFPDERLRPGDTLTIQWEYKVPE